MNLRASFVVIFSNNKKIGSIIFLTIKFIKNQITETRKRE